MISVRPGCLSWGPGPVKSAGDLSKVWDRIRSCRRVASDKGFLVQKQ